MNFSKNFRSIVLPAALAAVTTPVASAGITFGIGQDNVIVSGNMTASGGEVSGATVVGNNLTSAYQYAIALPQNSTTSAVNTLIVGNNINTSGSQLTLNAGQAVYGGSITGTVHQNDNNTPIQNTSLASTLSGNVGGYLTSLSSSFQQLSSTNTAAHSVYTDLVNGSVSNNLTDQNGKLSFNAVAGTNGTAVLNIDSSIFSTSNYAGNQYGLNLYSNATNGAAVTNIVFNVTGTSADFNTKGFDASAFGSLAPHILFNFYQAGTIVSESNFGYFYGALLAPTATYTNNADNQGSVYVQNFNMKSEVHLPGSDNTSSSQAYAGFVPAAVPEPATVVSTLTGLAMAGVIFWRRRRRAH